MGKIMKYHKIRNVPLGVCTAEAKIAYNVAFLHLADYRTAWKKQAAKCCGIAKADFIAEAKNWAMSFILNDREICQRYNIDAIDCCLRAGIEDYFNADYAILTSYAEIGKIFKSYYLK